MSKILYIDASVRKNSRTKELGDYLIKKLNNDYEYLRLIDAKFIKLDEEKLLWRMKKSEVKDFSDHYFDYAKMVKGAEEIVIVAPFWDLSFPSVLKDFIEEICINNLTFYYNEDGIPVSLVKTKKVYYVTTAGGFIPKNDYGYSYIKEVFSSFFGVENFELVKAEGLDILGNNEKEIIEKAKKNIDAFIKNIGKYC